MSHSLGRLLLQVLRLIVFVMLVGLITINPLFTLVLSLLVWNYHFVLTLINRLNTHERLLKLREQEPDPVAPSSGTTRNG